MAENGRRGFAAAGDYYSPITDPAHVAEYLTSSHYDLQTAQARAMIDLPFLMSQWDAISAHSLDFPLDPTSERRYYARNNQFPLFDAWLLSGFLGFHRPKRIIEIGAGYSTAVMLDAFDAKPETTPEHFTTIDVDLTRLRRLNPPDSITAIEQPVQSVPLSLFTELEAGDLLFIDSSHVLKTGSDVHYEYLHILPSLAPGVHVHIHDIHFPFEYPDRWTLTENRSWNEVYLVHMILTYSDMFSIEFFADAYLQLLDDMGRPIDPKTKSFLDMPLRPFMKRAGSLYLQKTR